MSVNLSNPRVYYPNSFTSETWRQIQRDHSTLIAPPRLNDNDVDELILDERFEKYIEPFSEGLITPDELKSSVLSEYLRFKDRLINLQRFLTQYISDFQNNENLVDLGYLDSTDQGFNQSSNLSEERQRHLQEIEKIIGVLNIFQEKCPYVQNHLSGIEILTETEASQLFADLRWMESTIQYGLIFVADINYNLETGEIVRGDNFRHEEIIENLSLEEENLLLGSSYLYFDKTLEESDQKEKIIEGYRLFASTPTGKRLLELLEPIINEKSARISLSIGDSNYGSAAHNGIATRSPDLVGYIRFNAEVTGLRSPDNIAVTFANELFDQMGFFRNTSPFSDLGILTGSPQYQLLGVVLNDTIREELLALKENRQPKSIDLRNYIQFSPYYALSAPSFVGAQYSEEQISRLNELSALVTRGEYSTFQEILDQVNPYMNNL